MGGPTASSSRKFRGAVEQSMFAESVHIQREAKYAAQRGTEQDRSTIELRRVAAEGTLPQKHTDPSTTEETDREERGGSRCTPSLRRSREDPSSNKKGQASTTPAVQN